MQTLTGIKFSTIRPGSRVILRSPFTSVFTDAIAEEEDVIRPTPRTFAEVPEGCVFKSHYNGSVRTFTKLRETHLIGETTRDQHPRHVNAVLQGPGEPVLIDAKAKVFAADAPKYRDGRKLRKTFFEFALHQAIPVNVLLEDTDVATNPLSRSGTLDYFTDSP